MILKNILVTGGAGYIGAHMTRVLLENGYAPTVLDNLSTGYREFVPPHVAFIQADLKDARVVAEVFSTHRFDAVIHFAGSIVVSESVMQPEKYHRNNVEASECLLNEMMRRHIGYFIFSSTAAVYGEAKQVPVTEEAPLMPQSPYAETKVLVEKMLQERFGPAGLKFMAVRYFNVCGSHQDEDIGIKMDNPTHLIPNVMRAANGRKPYLDIFGDDYPTKDGTCIRDYVYVMDLCRGHLAALNALAKGVPSDIINLGSGSGFSVKEIIMAAERVTGHPVPVKISPRRGGDMPQVVASYKKAERLLGWTPQTPLDAILETAWKWEKALTEKNW